MNRTMMLLTLILTFALAAPAVNAAAPEEWDENTFVIWPVRPDAPDQTAVVSWSDWLVFGDATFGRPGVRFVLNRMAAAGIRTVWWRTFGGGHALYSSQVDGVTMANYAGQGADYSRYDSLRDAVEFSRKLGLRIYAWFTPLEEAHAWGDNVRSRYADLHRDLWDRTADGRPALTPSFFYPEYRRYKLALAREMLEKYDVDGLVLDFERAGAPIRDNRWGYLPEAVRQFRQKNGGSGRPAPDDPAWLNFRAGWMSELERQIYHAAKARRPEAELVIMFPAARPLTAHWDASAWARENTADAFTLAAHGRKGWGSPVTSPAPLLERYRQLLKKPLSMIIYTLNGNRDDIEAAVKATLDAGCRRLVWFETTYLYFRRLYALPRALAVPAEAELTSPEYDFTGGGELRLVAAGEWTLACGNRTLASGGPDRAARIAVPSGSGRQRLTVRCRLAPGSDKAGAALQGYAVGADGKPTAIRTDSGWNSRQGRIATIAQPGIPPFLAPLDPATEGAE